MSKLIKIQELCNSMPNDAELGSAIRKLMNTKEEYTIRGFIPDLSELNNLIDNKLKEQKSFFNRNKPKKG